MVTEQYKKTQVAERDYCALELSQNQVMMLLLLVVALSSLVRSAPVVNASLPLDCEDVYNLKISSQRNASVPSGVYTIYPAGSNNPVKVYCDMGCADSSGPQDGKWTVIQRRINGNVSFYRTWQQYKDGFGNVSDEYWLGLENMFLMTYREKYQLRVDMEDFEKGSAYAQYSLFNVDTESNSYKLSIGNYINGGAGDSLSYVNGAGFSTFDKGQASYNADIYGGGFWYYSYYYYYYSYLLANPNGLYKRGNVVNQAYTGIMWQTWKGNYYSLKSITMKIRRLSLDDLANL